MTPISPSVLIEALRPFAEAASVFHDLVPNERDTYVSVGSLRRARAAIQAWEEAERRATYRKAVDDLNKMTDAEIDTRSPPTQGDPT